MSKLAPWIIIRPFIIDRAREEREETVTALDHKIKPQGNSESLHDCSLPDRARERERWSGKRHSLKGIVHQNETSLIIYSPSCHFKPVRLSIFCETPIPLTGSVLTPTNKSLLTDNINHSLLFSGWKEASMFKDQHMRRDPVGKGNKSSFHWFVLQSRHQTQLKQSIRHSKPTGVSHSGSNETEILPLYSLWMTNSERYKQHAKKAQICRTRPGGHIQPAVLFAVLQHSDGSSPLSVLWIHLFPFSSFLGKYCSSASAGIVHIV